PRATTGRIDVVLTVLSKVPSASAVEIAEETGLARSTVTYRIRKLEAQGLVERIGEPRSPKQRYRLP
ncbi:MAG: MarR family transcriptional regulator, partial [Eggerthellaceae bacterium]|nr:MarR family transcriptional regulator [Eggerthellaceae bacterium]